MRIGGSLPENKRDNKRVARREDNARVADTRREIGSELFRASVMITSLVEIPMGEPFLPSTPRTLLNIYSPWSKQNF